MISQLVQSAFDNGYLSVESEGLLRQMVAMGLCRNTDLNALQSLSQAVSQGEVRREAPASVPLPLPTGTEGPSRPTARSRQPLSQGLPINVKAAQ